MLIGTRSGYLRAVARIDELCGDAHAAGAPSHTALEDVASPQISGDVADVGGELALNLVLLLDHPSRRRQQGILVAFQLPGLVGRELFGFFGSEQPGQHAQFHTICGRRETVRRHAW